jgi:DNA-binding response OmpR family regulator
MIVPTDAKARFRRVLIIDDDASALECFAQTLLEQGDVVCAVQSVEAGLADATLHPPDAILLDLHLPVTDGLEGLRRLRAAPINVTAPVAILTGDYFIDEDVTRELMSLGARIHFKPVWDTDVRQIVDGLLNQRTGQHR